MNLKYLLYLFKRSRNRLKRKLGMLLFDPIADTPTLPITNIKHIVFIRWDSKWGDSIVSSLIFASLRNAYPNAKITVITSSAMETYFRNYLNIEQIIVSPAKPSYLYLKTIAKQLGEVDLLIHYSKFLKIKDMYFLSKVHARFVAGLDDEIRQINLKLGKKTQHMHFAQKFTYLFEYLGIPKISCEYQVPLDIERTAKVDIFLKSKVKQPLLVINTYSAGKGRCLDRSNTKKIIMEVLNISPSINILLLAAPDTLPEVQSLCGEINLDKVFYYPQCQTIYDAIALVSRAAWVISVDTAIVHIASGLNKPLLAMYNPDQEYSEWHPNSDHAISFFSNSAIPPDINGLDWQQLRDDISKLLS